MNKPPVCKEGRSAEAARFQGSATALLEQFGVQLEPRDKVAYDQTAAAVRTSMGEAGYRQAYEAGKGQNIT
jgi:hypothetical protein